MAKKILWLSRHDMTEEQVSDLKRIYGDDTEVTKVDKTIKTADDILDGTDAFDIFAVVLPIDLIADLFAKTNKEIITAKSERVRTNETVFNPATQKNEPQFKFVHKCWQRYKTVKIEMEQL